MEFFEFFSVNDKLAFSLSSDLEADRYACLVKKIKSNLMAVVISNRDKGKLTLSTDDEIHLIHDHDDETWITPAKLVQSQSYPLIIVKISGEPGPVSGHGGSELTMGSAEVESIENDHIVEEPQGEPVASAPDIDIDPAHSIDETPGNEFLIDEGASPEKELEVEEIGDKELEARSEGVLELGDLDNDVDVVSSELDEIPDIDTSELEAELEADIEVSLGENADQVEAEGQIELDESLLGAEAESVDDGLDDMETAQSQELDLKEVGESEPAEAPPAAEPDVDSTPLEEAETVETLDEAPALHESSIETKTAVPEPEGPRIKPFEDFFGFEYIVVDAETAEKLEGIINKFSSAQRVSFDAADEIDDLDLGENIDSALKDTLKSLLSRVARIENIVGRFSGGDAFQARLSFGGLFSEGEEDPLRKAVCLTIDRSGIYAAIDEPLPDGACVLLLVNRQWNPPLHFDAVAVLLESETKENGVSAGKFRFTAIHPDDSQAILDYLERGPGYLERLKEVSLG